MQLNRSILRAWAVMRVREMLCLANGLFKSLLDGSVLLILRPDGTLQEVNYKAET